MGKSVRIGVLLFVIAGGGLIPALPARADAGWCSNVPQPHINIKTSTDNIYYDYTKSEKELNNFHIDTVNPYGNSVISDVGGLMQGGISVSHFIRYGTLTNTQVRQICNWYTDVTVSIHINPTIYVSREHPPGTCLHNAILQHEHQHVMIDRDIVNKYARIIGQNVRETLYKQSVFGPVDLSREAELKKFLADNIQYIVTRDSEAMNRERQQRQQALDNINEYERVNHQCR